MHWRGHPADLTLMKSEVWQYIDSNWHSGADLAAIEGRAVRALLCVLEPGGDEEHLSMIAEWFAAVTREPQPE